MTSISSFLPTSGTPEPRLTRAPVPSDLPDSLIEGGQAEEERQQQTSPFALEEASSDISAQNSDAASPLNLAGPAAVSVQISEAESLSPDANAKDEGLSTGAKSADGTELTEEEKKIVEDLKARDEEVRRHENAHKAVGGTYTGAIEYEYTRGPDGRQYAVAGKVSIDTSTIPGDPAATIEKLRIVQAAALAPADPSGADKAVAAKAAAAQREAEAELREKKAEETEEALNGDSDDTNENNSQDNADTNTQTISVTKANNTAQNSVENSVNNNSGQTVEQNPNAALYGKYASAGEQGNPSQQPATSAFNPNAFSAQSEPISINLIA